MYPFALANLRADCPTSKIRWMAQDAVITADPNAKAPEPVDGVVEEYLSRNPTIADALRTFQVAQEEYRRSLLALTSVRVVTTHSTNLE